MARIERTVFISYRRTDVYTALAVYENLKNQGYDVFFDYRSISSGDFEQIITSNIKARAHFLLILTPTALDRCNEPGDWLRREIELAIDEKRNIIPLFFKGFRFGDPSVSAKLTGTLKNLSRYNGLNVHEDYFDEAMQRVQTQYLNIPLNTVLHPVSTEVLKVVRQVQVAADNALEQIEDLKELVKQEEKSDQPTLGPTPEGKTSVPAFDVPVRREVAKNTIPSLRLIGGIVGGLVILGLLLWSTIKRFQNLPAIPQPTSTHPYATFTPPPASETSIPITPTFGIGSSMIGKDGMTLLFVPAGEFTMGSDADDALAECRKFSSACQRDWFTDEEPQHSVQLDAFWIDKTEVTNKMYSLCVSAGVCKEPTSKESFSHPSYYGNSEYDNYPVIYVDWNMAKTYCEWAGRRLPTEAEWEKAARGTNANIYPWGNTFDGTRANFCDTNCSFEWANKSSDDGYADVAPVGNYPSGRSIYGALDMAGNVWEWVNDWYDVYPGGDASASSDFGQKYRVLRGGSWFNHLYGRVSSAVRFGVDPSGTYYNVGFRCSRLP